MALLQFSMSCVVWFSWTFMCCITDKPLTATVITDFAASIHKFTAARMQTMYGKQLMRCGFCLLWLKLFLDLWHNLIVLCIFWVNFRAVFRRWCVDIVMLTVRQLKASNVSETCLMLIATWRLFAATYLMLCFQCIGILARSSYNKVNIAPCSILWFYS